MTVTSKCKFPHDLNYAIQLLEDEIGARLLENQQLLDAAKKSILGMPDLLNTGNTILDQLLAKNGAGTPTSSNITSGADVAAQYGLLPDDPTTEQQEKFVANAGITLVDNVVYLTGDMSPNDADFHNIQTLRRLYFALGMDLDKTQDTLKNSTKTIIVHDKMVLTNLSQQYFGNPLDQIKIDLNAPYLIEEDYALVELSTSENQPSVMTTIYLTKDQTIDQTLNMYSDAKNLLISNIFHLNGVDSSPNAVKRYMDVGYSGDKLGAILAGTDLYNYNIFALTNTLDSLIARANRIIQRTMQLAQSMTASYVEPASLRTEAKNTQTDIQNLINGHTNLMTDTLFEVSPEVRTDIIDVLRTKHTDDKIKYILENRQDITGIYFNPPDDVFMGFLAKATSAALPGTTYISNAAVNKPPSAIDQSALIKMYRYLVEASNKLDTLTLDSINLAVVYLSKYTGINPYTTTVTVVQGQPSADTILQGQPSAASPSSILTPQFDVGKTMDIDERINNVYGTFKDLNDIYPKSISEPIVEVITSVVELFKKVFSAIDRIIESAQKTLFALKNKLDSWLSKHASLTGGGDFGSSLLKCSVNWDISLSTDLLDRLFNFVMQILSQVVDILTKMKAWISNILNKVLCFPVNILNSLIGKISIPLPSACRMPRFDLPPAMTTSLNDLINCSLTKSIILQSFDKDLATLKMSVGAAPDRLGQFRDSALCESSATSKFMNASALNIGI